MNTVKFFNKDKSPFAKLNNVLYKGYTVGNLPTRFAFVYNEETEQEGITEWFKHGGLTYVEVKDSIWSKINKDNERMNVEMLFKCMK